MYCYESPKPGSPAGCVFSMQQQHALKLPSAAPIPAAHKATLASFHVNDEEWHKNRFVAIVTAGRWFVNLLSL